MKKRTIIIVGLLMCMVGCNGSAQESVYKTHGYTQTKASEECTTTAANYEQGSVMEYISVGADSAQKLGVDKTIVFICNEAILKEVDPQIYDKVNELLVKKYGCDFIVEFRGYNFNSAEYQQELRAMKEKGLQADIIVTGPGVSGFSNTYDRAIEDELLLQLNDELETKWGKLLYEAYPESVWSRTERDGKYYGFWNQPEATGQTVIVINKEYVQDEKEIANIDSIEDIIAFVDTVENIDEDVTKIAAYLSDILALEGYYAFGYGIYAKCGTDGKWQAVIGAEDEEIREAFKISAKLTESYYPADTYQQTQNINMGNFVAAIMTNLRIRQFNDKSLRVYDFSNKNVTDASLDVYICKCTRGYVEAITNSVTGIASWSQYKDEAVQVLALFASEPELANLLTYGIEGIHYTKSDDDIVMLDSGYSVPGTEMALGNRLITYPTGLETSQKEERYMMLDENYQESPKKLYGIDISEYQDILNKAEKAYAANAGWYLQDDFDEAADKLLADLKTAGIQTVIDYINQRMQ